LCPVEANVTRLIEASDQSTSCAFATAGQEQLSSDCELEISDGGNSWQFDTQQSSMLFYSVTLHPGSGSYICTAETLTCILAQLRGKSKMTQQSRQSVLTSRQLDPPHRCPVVKTHRTSVVIEKLLILTLSKSSVAISQGGCVLVKQAIVVFVLYVTGRVPCLAR